MASFVRAETVTGRMKLTSLVEIRSEPKYKEPFKPLAILAISTLEVDSKAIDLKQGGPR